MSDDLPVNVGIGIKATDDSGVDLVERLADNVEIAEAAIRKAQRQGGLPAIVARENIAGVQRLRRETDSLTSEIADLTKQLTGVDAGTEEFKRLTEQIEAARQKAAALNAEAERVPQQIQPRTGDTMGRADQGLSALSGLAGAVGGGGLGDLLGGGSAILDTAKSWKQLTDSMVGTPGLLGKVASAGASLAAPLGATAAGLGAVVAVAGPAALGLAAIAIAIHRYNEIVGPAKEAFNAALNAQDNYYRALATMTTEQVEAQVQDIERSQAALQAQRAELQDAIDRTWADAVANFGDAGARALEAVGALPLGDMREKLKEVDGQIQENIHTTTRLNQGLEQNAFAANDAAEAEERLANTRTNRILQSIQLETQLAQAVRDGNREAIAARRQAAADEIEAIQRRLPDLQALAAENSNVQNTVDGLIERMGLLQSDLAYINEIADPAAAARRRELDIMSESIGLIEARAKAEQQMSGLVREASTAQLEARRQVLEFEREAIQSMIPPLMELAGTSDEARAKLEQYRQQVASINQELRNIEMASPAVRIRETMRGLAEIENAEVEAARNIEDIRRAGLARIAEIEAAAIASQIQAAQRRDEAIVKSIQESQARINEANAEYMRSEREAFDRFRRTELEMTRRHNRDRLRLLEDINLSLMEAEEANDVVAFKQAKRRGELQLRRQSEDASDAERQRIDAFLREREEADRRNQETIERIRQQEEARQQAIQESYDKEMMAIAARQEQQIEAENKAISQRVAAEEAALLKRLMMIQQTYGLEAALIDEIAAKRIEDYKAHDQIVVARLEEDLNRHKDDLDRRARQERQIADRLAQEKGSVERTAAQQTANSFANSFSLAATVIGQQVTAMISQVVSAAQSARNSVIGNPSSGGARAMLTSVGGLPAIAFANEGVVDRPTLALLGEKLQPGEREAVVKFKMSDGLRGAGSNGPVLNIGSITVGDGVTAVEVEHALNRGFHALLQGMNNARRP